MSEQSDDQLREEIKKLYKVFSRYKLPEHVLGCPHCVTDQHHAQLYRAPLRQMTPIDLESFARKAMTTWGNKDDFRHFLPRIFELLARDAGGGWINPEIVFGKLTYGNWARWPEEERLAIMEFMHALWLNVLDHIDSPLDVDTCLCCIGQAFDDPSGFLAQWRIDVFRPHAIRFAEFVEVNVCRTRVGPGRTWTLWNAFWSNCPQSSGQVIRWLVSPERAAELERAFFSLDADNDEDAELLSNTLTYLSSFRLAAGEK